MANGCRFLYISPREVAFFIPSGKPMAGFLSLELIWVWKKSHLLKSYRNNTTTWDFPMWTQGHFKVALHNSFRLSHNFCIFILFLSLLYKILILLVTTVTLLFRGVNKGLNREMCLQGVCTVSVISWVSNPMFHTHKHGNWILILIQSFAASPRDIEGWILKEISADNTITAQRASK